jgi:hypothetical protein
MQYVVIFDNHSGLGDTLTSAFEDLQTNRYGDTLRVEDCFFGEVEEIEVVQEIKQVSVSKIKNVK